MAHPRKKAPKFLHMLLDNKCMRFVEACENINFQITEDNEDISDDDLLNSIKSKYYDLHQLNQLRPSPF